METPRLIIRVDFILWNKKIMLRHFSTFLLQCCSQAHFMQIPGWEIIWFMKMTGDLQLTKLYENVLINISSARTNTNKNA